jgi:hypothetical protein
MGGAQSVGLRPPFDARWLSSKQEGRVAIDCGLAASHPRHGRRHHRPTRLPVTGRERYKPALLSGWFGSTPKLSELGKLRFSSWVMVADVEQPQFQGIGHVQRSQARSWTCPPPG